MTRRLILAFALLAGGTLSAKPASYLGSVGPLPDTVAHITSPSTGEIRFPNQPPMVGDRVKKGDVLAVIANRYNLHDAAHVSNVLWTYEQDMLEARYLAVEARVARERGERLKTLGSMSGQKVAELKAAEQVAAANYDKRKALYDQQSGQRLTTSLENRKLLAPIDGRIAVATFTQGQMVYEGLHLYRIVDLREVGFTARVPESSLQQWPAGTVAHIRFDDAGVGEFTGRLVRIVPNVDPTVQTREVLFRVDNPKELLRFGMVGRIEIE